MKPLQNIYFFILFFFLPFIAAAQYSIHIRISNFRDTSLLLTSYYGNKIKLVDTAYSKEPGNFTFKGKKDLPAGIYMAVSQEKVKLFEFIVNDKQSFSLETDTANYSLNMIVKSSEENAIFFDYMKYNEQIYRQNSELTARLKSMDPSEPEYSKIKIQADSTNQLSAEYKLKVIREKPDLFVSELFIAMQNVEIPEEIVSSGDSVEVFYYYKNHFFDFILLNDPRMMRTPLFSKKVDEYFQNLVVKEPDSVINSIDLIIAKARPSKEVVSYLVWNFTSEYQNPEYMGFDKVYVHLVDNYFSKEEIENTTPSILKTLQDQAERLRPVMIGQQASNMILLDTGGGYTSFEGLTNDYIILLFWDADCGICKNEIFELQKIYKKIWFDFEVYAVNVNSDLDKWKEGIEKMSLKWVNVNGTRSVTPDFHDLYDITGTPRIIILDKDHRIIANNISAKQILPFLEKYQKKQAKQ